MAVAAKQRVQYRDLREYLDLLEEAGLLTRVTGEVDLKHEIGALCTYGMEHGGPGLIFENVKGYKGKLLVSNIIYSVEQLALAFNTEPDAEKIYSIIVEGHKNRIPSVVLDSGPCKEEKFFGDDVNLLEMPTPWWHELDGGQYIGTAAGVIDRDPDTGILNMGTYRAMIVDKNTLTICGQLSPRVLKNEARGQATKLAIAIGMDPLLTLASGSPVAVDENGYMEYEAAGAWRGAPTELVKCETSDLLVPANAEYIIEGELRPGERHVEGPHGEAGGFYGQNEQAFLIHVDCVTHRRNPVNYGIICLLEEDYPRWLFRSGAFQDRLRRDAPDLPVKRAYLPELGGRGWGGIIVAADIQDPSDARRIVDACWRITPNRWVIVVDDDCDVRNWNEVMWRVVTAVRPREDVFTGKAVHDTLMNGQRSRAEEYDIDSQIPDPTGLNASFKFKFKNLAPINKVSSGLMSKAAARWRELGLP
ncbi:MAG TPA: UbiD family decarboxylase [Chloroflexota bacterium]|nr:UbiD family decarboxylase [Chloroflexota bacterium]